MNFIYYFILTYQYKLYFIKLLRDFIQINGLFSLDYYYYLKIISKINNYFHFIVNFIIKIINISYFIKKYKN